MIFLRRFLSDGASEGAASDAPGPDAGSDNTQQQSTQVPAPAFTMDELKSFGFESKEAFLENYKKMQEASKPDAAKAKELEIEKANFLKFAAENDLIDDNFKKHESLSARADRDLVFENFVAEEKKDNPEASDEEIKESFENEYKLSSDNAKAKAKGEARLKKEAADLRSPAVNAFNNAKGQYERSKQIGEAVKEFDSLVDEVIKGVPPKVIVKAKDGDKEIDIDTDLTEDQRKSLVKTFKNENVFGNYFESTPEEKAKFKEKLTKKINGFIRENTFNPLIQKAYEAGKGVGTASGSNIGAENSFALTGGAAGKGAKVVDLEESNKRIAEARQRYAKR